VSTFERFLRVFGIVVACSIIGFAIFSFFSTNSADTKDTKDLSLHILPFYIAFSGFILLGIECGIGFLRKSMKFLTNMFGRGFFSIYIGIMCLCIIRPTTQDF
jgi:hypothetical protein